MDIQKKIKDNVENVQCMYRDIISWEKEMKRKENCLSLSKGTENDKELPPIRTKYQKGEMNSSSKKMTDNVNVNDVDISKREESLFEKDLGNELVKQEKWTAAIYHYSQAINCFSKDATFYCNRAYCFLKTDKYKEAEADCTVALQIDPQYVKAYHRRALALKELSQLKEARENLITALELEPDNTRIKNDKLKLEKAMFDRVSFLKKTSETKPDMTKENKKNLAYIKKEKGNVHVKKKEWKLAIECYTEACRLYPDDTSFYLNRALCFIKINEPKKAILDCIRVLELDPDNVKAYYRKGLANQTLGNYSKAHDDFLTAFKLDPSDRTIQDNLIKIEKSLGILPKEILDRENKESQIERTSTKFCTPPKRITGEKFIALGGCFVDPVKKSAHQLSQKPFKTIKIIDKNDDTLKDALEELNIPAKKINNIKENKDPNEKFIDVIQKDFSEKSNVYENNTEVDIDSLITPKTSMQFVSAWDKLTNSELQYQYLKKINGKNFPFIFKEALESYIFSEILKVLATQFVKAGDLVYEYVHGFSKVKRISALLLFATEEDTANIKILFNHMKNMNEIPEDELELLKSFYYC